MNTRPTYQVMPPLSAEEYAALKADIAARGVQVPAEYDDEGHILDGFHRVQICQELGLDCPKVVRSGLTDAEKWAHAWALNLTRRHLSKAQKRAIAHTLRQEGWIQARIAQTLGLSQATISSWLDEFIRTDKLPQPDHIRGRDGKRYPAKRVHAAAPRSVNDAKITPAAELPATPASTPPGVDPDVHPDQPSGRAQMEAPQPHPEAAPRPAVDRGARVLDLIEELYRLLNHERTTIGWRPLLESWSPTTARQCRRRCGPLIRELEPLHKALSRVLRRAAVRERASADVAQAVDAPRDDAPEEGHTAASVIKAAEEAARGDGSQPHQRRGRTSGSARPEDVAGAPARPKRTGIGARGCESPQRHDLGDSPSTGGVEVVGVPHLPAGARAAVGGNHWEAEL